MNSQWEQLTIHKIVLAIYVPLGGGRPMHADRPSHGLVLNDENTARDYYFSDGTVLHTKGGSLFYLPKGSTYEVKNRSGGGCYAINFQGDLQDAPFCVQLKSREKLEKNFRIATEEWKRDPGIGRISALRALYDAIYRLKRDQREYISGAADKIAPALEWLDTHFTDSNLTVADLADRCHMSQVYLRRLFQSRFGMGPKEYLIRKRLQYAGQLLQSGQFAVNEVAKLCGYTEPCHFTREFTDRTGTPPSRYEQSGC